MDQTKLEEQLKKRMPVFMLVFGQFMLTPLILSGVSWMVVGQQVSTGSAVGDTQQRAMILSIFAAALLLLGDNFGNLVAKNFKSKTPLDAESVFLNKQFTRSIVIFACFEAAAILGFVASYLTREVIWSAVLSVLSILAMFREIPTPEKIRQAAREGQGVGA